MNFLDAYSRSSIKIKLALISAVLFCVLFFIVALLVENALNDSFSLLENDRVEILLNKLHAIMNDRPDYAEGIRKELEWEAAYVPAPQFLVRILDSSGRIIVESGGMSSICPPRLFPITPVATSKKVHVDDVIIQAGNNRYYMLKSDAWRLHVPDKIANIQIALDITSAKKIDSDNHNKIVLLFISGVIAATTVSSLIIRRILSPLEEFTDFSRHISVETINARIIHDRWPKEFRRFSSVFNMMLDRLENSFGQLSEYTSNLAHELRTPLTNIIGESEIALWQVRTPEEYQRVLVSAREECLRLSRIIDNVLFLARSASPHARIERIPFDPVAEIMDLCAFYEGVAEERCAKVSCNGAGTLVGDPLLFQRAINNLLANSLTYSSPGVEINLTIRLAEGESVEFEICDSGHGIAEEDLARVFDRFYRADRSRSNYQQGSGLGLPIVKSIMDLHGGTVTVASHPGRGTTVTLRFPHFIPDEPENHPRKDITNAPVNY
ncbi:MAG: heavy metal sensor histidine kinase [Desulfuromonadales bacterium]